MNRLIVCAAVLVASLGFAAQERVELDAPVRVDPGIGRARVAAVIFEQYPDVRVQVTLCETDDQGAFVGVDRCLHHEYRDTVDENGDPEPTATLLIRALNRANLSTKSLQRRILERLQADGVIGLGPIAGAPR